MQPLGHNRHGPKIGRGSAPFVGRGARSPSNTMSPGPTFLPSGILTHAAIWPQQTWAENWGKLGPHLTQCGQGKAYVHSKWHLDPSNRLATIHQHHRQIGQDRQWSDSIQRTVLPRMKPVDDFPRFGSVLLSSFSALVLLSE